MRLQNLAVSMAILTVPALAADHMAMTIRVLDQARLSPSTIQKMEKYVASTLTGMDVEVKWVDCATDVMACKTARAGNEFWLRILPQVPPDAGVDQLGFTQPDRIQCVNVIFPRVANLVEAMHLDTDQILGAAVAHEVGHLYLGDNGKAHSKTGIMCGVWSHREIELARIGELRFSREQGERIRAAMKRASWAATTE